MCNFLCDVPVNGISEQLSQLESRSEVHIITKCANIFLLNEYFRHLPIESRLPYYSAWSEINQELSVQPSNPSNVFVKIIVQNIYDSLPDVHRTQIVSELRDDDISQIAAMGMERIASHNIVVAENCSRALTTAVSDLLERINSGDRTTKSHNQLVTRY